METGENLSGATGATAPGIVAGESVRAAGQRVTGAFNGERRGPGPGRPRKDGRPVGSGPAPKVPKPDRAGDGGPALPAGVVQNAVDALCRSVDRFVRSRVHTSALIITAGNQSLADDFEQESKMADEQRVQIALLSETVCQQYGFLGQHAPACLLAVSLAAYGAQVTMTLSRLEKIAQLNARNASERREPVPE